GPGRHCTSRRASSTKWRTTAGSRLFTSVLSRRVCAARSSRTLRLPVCARYPARVLASLGEPDAGMVAKYDLVAGTIDRFIDTTFAVPTRSESYKYAAYDGLMRLARGARLSAAG